MFNIILGMILFSFSLSSNAAILTFGYNAKIVYVIEDYGLGEPDPFELNIGDSITGSFSFSSDSPLIYYSSTESIYAIGNSNASWSLNLDKYVFSGISTRTHTLGISDNEINVDLGIYKSSDLIDEIRLSANIELQSADVINSDFSILTMSPNISDYDNLRELYIEIDFPRSDGVWISSDITELYLIEKTVKIPEPNSIFLFFLGLVFLVYMKIQSSKLSNDHKHRLNLSHMHR